MVIDASISYIHTVETYVSLIFHILYIYIFVCTICIVYPQHICNYIEHTVHMYIYILCTCTCHIQLQYTYYVNILCISLKDIMYPVSFHSISTCFHPINKVHGPLGSSDPKICVPSEPRDSRTPKTPVTNYSSTNLWVRW